MVYTPPDSTSIPSLTTDWGRYVRPALATAPTIVSTFFKWNPLILSPALYLVSQMQGGDRKRVAHWGNLCMLTVTFLRVGMLGSSFTGFGKLGDVLAVGLAGVVAIWANQGTTMEGPSPLWRASPGHII